jgi:isoleucyl-tRNA synthetase
MDYKETLNLPTTDFPMKANLPVREGEILAVWEERRLYHAIRESRKGAPRFILHDGPPYANGNIHAGTALNKILKDIVVKAKTMSGVDAPYVPGWDCHGLPIELQVDKQLGKKKREMSQIAIREECRAYAMRFVNEQRNEFKRLGVLADWERPYLTLDKEYEVGIAKELARFVENDGLYRGNKPVHWCPSCVTALAEAEVEYADHTSPSIDVSFRLDDASADKLGLTGVVNAVIWTTTPWTLPANLAVTLHPDFTYVALKVGEATYIVAEELAEPCMKRFGFADYKTVGAYRGAEFDGLLARHPFIDRTSRMIVGDHVTLEQGTGLVHTAPGHGQEDYVIGQRYGLEVYNPVNQYGIFVEGTPHVAGMKVWDANAAVIDLLAASGALLARRDIEHSYPHCWRCRGPIIFRATPQWFISMEKNDLRKNALAAIRQVNWIPKWGEERIFGMVENRPDWCVSRQRSWGVPIFAFICDGCGDAVLDKKIARRVVSIMESEGIDAWYAKGAKELLPDGVVCPSCGGSAFTQGGDILDVWFDSGVSHAVVVDADERLDWPADLYLEGSDQHRGWFHTSLLCSVGVRGVPPYRQVLTHGYVVDGHGKKMSKSIGNTILPQQIIDKYGAEVLRLWVSSEDYREDIRLSDEILKRLTDAYRKIRNTVRFLLGNLADFDPAAHTVPVAGRPEIDRFILSRFDELAAKVTEAYERYDFHVFYHAMHNFCVVDLSSFYLDIVKDRVYTYPAASPYRRSAQATMYELTVGMLKLMAPVLSFTAEEAWGHLPGDPALREESIHLSLFPAVSGAADSRLAEEWERLLLIRSETLQALEIARREKVVGHSLDAKIVISAFKNDHQLLERRKEFLPFLFIVSQVELVSDPMDGAGAYKSEEAPGLTVMVEKASGAKCERCWNYSDDIGASVDHPTVCGRCVANLAEAS